MCNQGRFLYPTIFKTNINKNIPYKTPVVFKNSYKAQINGNLVNFIMCR